MSTLKIVLRLHRRVDLCRVVVFRHRPQRITPLLSARSRREWEERARQRQAALVAGEPR